MCCLPGAVAAATVLALAAAVEQGSAHPLARADAWPRAAMGAAIVTPAATDQSAILGRAAAGRVGAQRVSIGSPRHAREEGADPGMVAADVGPSGIGGPHRRRAGGRWWAAG